MFVFQTGPKLPECFCGDAGTFQQSLDRGTNTAEKADGGAAFGAIVGGLCRGWSSLNNKNTRPGSQRPEPPAASCRSPAFRPPTTFADKGIGYLKDHGCPTAFYSDNRGEPLADCFLGKEDRLWEVRRRSAVPPAESVPWRTAGPRRLLSATRSGRLIRRQIQTGPQSIRPSRGIVLD